MYIYIISTGVYSDYQVDCLAANPKRYTKAELETLVNEIKNEYKKRGYSTRKYEVEDDKVDEIFYEKLTKNGFKMIYPAGEFHHSDYSCFDDIRAYVPWVSENKEPSALRIGLA